MKEIWKEIPGFEGYYEASNQGRVRSIERVVRSGRGYKIVKPTILKPSIDEWGYEKVCLRKKGKSFSRKVNRIIAQTFIPNPNDYPQVNHIDGVKQNNNVDNLEWCTCSHNMLHCHANGLSDWNTNVRVVETGKVYHSVMACARDINGHDQLIRACLNGKRKTHKGYHFEVVGKRASEKHKRNNFKRIPPKYDSKIKVDYLGETHTLREWGKICDIKQHTLECRYYRGDRGDRLFREVRKHG